MHSERLRHRALHDVARLRDVMQRIAELSDGGRTQGSAIALRGLLDEIGILSRAALAGATPPDAEWTQDREHAREHEAVRESTS